MAPAREKNLNESKETTNCLASPRTYVDASTQTYEDEEPQLFMGRQITQRNIINGSLATISTHTANEVLKANPDTQSERPGHESNQEQSNG